MSFKEFCDQAQKIDDQIVETNKTFVISFGKAGGNVFSVDPEVLVLFLKFLSQHHGECRNAIESNDRFDKNKNYVNYQEKPYRELYKYAGGDESLKSIASLGGSQTKELTKLISKLIAYAAERPYSKIEDNTYFDKETVDLALIKIPSDLTLLESDGKKSISVDPLKIKQLFINWLKKKELSEKSIKSYSGPSIDFADTVLSDYDGVQKPIYEITSFETITRANEWLKSNQQWIDKNNKGNNMFQAGLNHYLNFLKDGVIIESLSNSIEVLQKESSLRDFALSVFEYFYGSSWSELLSDAENSDSELNGVRFSAIHIGPFKRIIGKFDNEQSKESLTSSTTQRFFEKPIFTSADKYYYFSTQWNGEGSYPLSFNNLKEYIEGKFPSYQVERTDNEFRLVRVTGRDFIGLPKPFILLAGISGTGKTRFVRMQAREHGVAESNYCLVPVRPDWHEPSDMLGYVSYISEHPRYITTKVLDFIISAWRVIAPNASKNGTGELKSDAPPYWLCLDEMNLAPVEQYFADYLSVLESREFKDGIYTCQPLLDSSVLSKCPDMRSDLGLESGSDDGLWEYFMENGIPLPPNLIVAGTVNMDETTHGFSRKVIDRAFTIDYGEFYPNDFDEFFNPSIKEKVFTWTSLVQVGINDIANTFDADGSKSRQFLNEVNSILKRSPFELAFRALNELMLYVASYKPEDEIVLQAVWDDFLMTKILPRIDGDEDKLRYRNDGDVTNILNRLEEVLQSQLGRVWDNGRPDLFREKSGTTDPVQIPCRSRDKINWMKDRLDINTFTSYWP